MNKQELIERIEGLKNLFGNKSEYVKIDTVIRLISELEEPQEVTVPQFVADWYEEYKDNLEYNIWSYIYNWERKEKSAFKDWINIGRNNPIQTLINMHQFGYEVEKEKRYTVKIKGVCFNDYLIFEKINKKWFFSSIYEVDHHRGNHTKKELDEAGFWDVFNSPLFEVKEVE